MNTFKHKLYNQEFTLKAVVSTYAKNHRTAIEIFDTEDGMPFLTASVNVPEVELEDDEIIIKTYSENEGIYLSLLKAELITKAEKSVQVGSHMCPVVKLTDKFEK